MPTILALDTTSELGSLAVRQNGQSIAEIERRSTDGFSHLLFGMIEELLDKAGVSLRDIDCFAAASGPGSFTGVRVGLSAIKGLAEAMGKPVAGISSLRAMGSFGSFPLRAVVLDARRGEVYAGVYDSNLEPVMPEAVLKFIDWLETLGSPLYEFIWRPGEPFESPLAGTRFADMPVVHAPRSLASAIATCADIDGTKGRWLDPAALDANYVRRSDAELFWKD